MSLLPSIAVVEHVALQGLLYSLFFMFSIPVLAAAIGIVFLAVMFVTFAFSFFGIDLWKSVEKLFDQLKQDRLATAANSIAKMASSDAEKTKQLAFLAKKNSLLYEGRILAQRDVYQAEEIEHLQKSHSPKSVPSQQTKLEKHRQESRQASDSLFKSWRQFKDLHGECPGGAWIREDERKQSKGLSSQEEKTTCKYRQGCCAFGCGCCERHRAFTEIQRERPDIYFYSHCTSECSCCLRRDLRIFGR